MDSENPEWPDQIVLEYNFETTQQVLNSTYFSRQKLIQFNPISMPYRQIIIKVYDRDGGYDQGKLEKHQFIGECHFALTTIMCAAGQRYSTPLHLPGGVRRYDTHIH